MLHGNFYAIDYSMKFDSLHGFVSISPCLHALSDWLYCRILSNITTAAISQKSLKMLEKFGTRALAIATINERVESGQYSIQETCFGLFWLCTHSHANGYDAYGRTVGETVEECACYWGKSVGYSWAFEHELLDKSIDGKSIKVSGHFLDFDKHRLSALIEY